jgi:hypothetical protein
MDRFAGKGTPGDWGLGTPGDWGLGTGHPKGLDRGLGTGHPKGLDWGRAPEGFCLGT